MVRIECDTNLNAKKIIEMHNDIIKDFGGEPGLRDLATLEYVVFRVNRSRNSFRNAAIALHGIATGHPFIDGNKRLLLLLQKIF
ncbi:MAG: Fic family protein [Methanoregula sp.]